MTSVRNSLGLALLGAWCVVLMNVDRATAQPARAYDTTQALYRHVWDVLTEHDRQVVGITTEVNSFRAGVSDRTASFYGFGSSGDVARAETGQPAVVYDIGWTDIESFDATKDPSTLLRDAIRITYPLLVDSIAVSSLGLVKRNGQWRPGVYGAGEFIGEVDSVRNKLTNKHYLPAEFAVLDIRPFNLTFLAWAQGKEFDLYPVDKLGSQFVASFGPTRRFVSAREAFLKLKASGYTESKDPH